MLANRKSLKSTLLSPLVPLLTLLLLGTYTVSAAVSEEALEKAKLLDHYRQHKAIYEPIQQELMYANWLDRMLENKYAMSRSLYVQRNQAMHRRTRDKTDPIIVGLLQSSLTDQMGLKNVSSSILNQLVRECRIPCRLISIPMIDRPLESYLPTLDNLHAHNVVPHVMLSHEWTHASYWGVVENDQGRFRKELYSSRQALRQVLGVVDLVSPYMDPEEDETVVKMLDRRMREVGVHGQVRFEGWRRVDLVVGLNPFSDVIIRHPRVEVGSATMEEMGGMMYKTVVLLPEWMHKTLDAHISSSTDALSQCYRPNQWRDALWFEQYLKQFVKLKTIISFDEGCSDIIPTHQQQVHFERVVWMVYLEQTVVKYRLSVERLRKYSRFPRALILYFGHSSGIELISETTLCQPLAQHSAKKTRVSIRFRSRRHAEAVVGSSDESDANVTVELDRCRIIPVLAFPTVESVVDFYEYIDQNPHVHRYLLGEDDAATADQLLQSGVQVMEDEDDGGSIMPRREFEDGEWICEVCAWYSYLHDFPERQQNSET